MLLHIILLANSLVPHDIVESSDEEYEGY